MPRSWLWFMRTKPQPATSPEAGPPCPGCPGTLTGCQHCDGDWRTLGCTSCRAGFLCTSCNKFWILN